VGAGRILEGGTTGRLAGAGIRLLWVRTVGYWEVTNRLDLA
jgi:hypothetical protein